MFGRLASDARLVNIARQILGDEVYIHQSRLNLKPGFLGKEFYWHSDFETWHVEDGMPRMRAVSCTILLTENNEFNGPLMLIPGSHKHYISCVGETPSDHYKQSLQKQEYGVPDPTSLEFLVERGGIQAPKGPAGSVVLFDCNTMHGSNSNISPYPRSNLFVVYNSLENALGKPRFGLNPRPEYIATREDVRPLMPLTADYS
jgi:ectoine hydroxylase